MRRANSAEPAAIHAALKTTDIADHIIYGGPIRFDEKGQNPNIGGVMLQNQNAKPVVVEPGGRQRGQGGVSPGAVRQALMGFAALTRYRLLPSWPDLFRPSAPFFAARKDMDGRDEHGHDASDEPRPAVTSLYLNVIAAGS